MPDLCQCPQAPENFGMNSSKNSATIYLTMYINSCSHFGENLSVRFKISNRCCRARRPRLMYRLQCALCHGPLGPANGPKMQLACPLEHRFHKACLAQHLWVPQNSVFARCPAKDCWYELSQNELEKILEAKLAEQINKVRTLAWDYNAWLDNQIERQREAVDGIKRDLGQKVHHCLTVLRARHDSVGIAAPIPEFQLGVFGSRLYNAALPNSDVDIVLEMRSGFDGIKGNDILVEVFNLLRADPRASQCTDVTKWKRTITYRMANIGVDFTFCWGAGATEHGPTMMSKCLRGLIAELVEPGRMFVRLAVDCMKRIGACYDRKGAVANKCKGVHWALIAVAFCKKCAAEGLPLLSNRSYYSRGYAAFCKTLPSPASVLYQFLTQVVDFEFETLCIDVLAPNPFLPRPADGSSAPMFLRDPSSSDAYRNLTERVDAASLSQIRMKLAEEAELLRVDTQRFWQKTRGRWSFLEGRAYSIGEPPRPSAPAEPPRPSAPTVATEHRSTWTVRGKLELLLGMWHEAASSRGISVTGKSTDVDLMVLREQASTMRIVPDVAWNRIKLVLIRSGMPLFEWQLDWTRSRPPGRVVWASLTTMPEMEWSRAKALDNSHITRLRRMIGQWHGAGGPPPAPPPQQPQRATEQPSQPAEPPPPAAPPPPPPPRRPPIHVKGSPEQGRLEAYSGHGLVLYIVPMVVQDQKGPDQLLLTAEEGGICWYLDGYCSSKDELAWKSLGTSSSQKCAWTWHRLLEQAKVGAHGIWSGKSVE